MAYLNPTAYLVTLDEFIGHWQDVDAALSPGTLSLSGGYGLADLQSARTDIASLGKEIEAARNVREGLAVGRDQARGRLRDRTIQFRRLVLALLPGTPYAQNLPTAPTPRSGTGRWEAALTETENLWAQIEADAPGGVPVPLLVAGGYGLAGFSADAAGLRALGTDVVGADQDLGRAIDRREEAWRAAHQRLVQYRLAVGGSFERKHPLLTSLPRLSAPYRKRAKKTAPEP